MKWYKRLYVKIFLSIWLACVAVLIATVLILGAVSEKERFREVVLATAKGYAERVVERYEQNGLQPLRRPPPPERWQREDHDHERDEHSRHWMKPPPDDEHFLRWKRRDLMRVIDLERNVQVAGPPPERWHGSRDMISFRLTSTGQRDYRVEVALNWSHSPLAHFIRTMLSVQMVLILLISALAASLLSWMIVGPINRLRSHTRALYNGELDTRTEQRLARRGDEIGELAREFDQMADYVEQTLNAHQKLMQDVSHELRAPLARLQAAAGLAEQRWGDDKVVTRIIRECERLDRLIGEILSLSRLDSSDTAGGPFEVAGVLEGLLEDLRFTESDRPFNFKAEQCRCHAVGNPALLERALGNVLGNACKHTPAGTPVDISLSAESATGQCIIRIRDHGPGVPAEALPHLFEPFYRSTSQDNGYGLGLSIAERAVRRAGGTISAANHPEGGLEVVIRLPALAN